jgi:hypothetical protein
MVSSGRMIALDELGIIRMGADGGLFKCVSDTAIKVLRK